MNLGGLPGRIPDPRPASGPQAPRNLPTLTPSRARAREGQSPPPATALHRIAPPETLAQAPEGRIASPSAGSGSHLAEIA